jgi:hypothetical protein
MWVFWTDPITTIVSLDMLRVGKLSRGVNKDFIGVTHRHEAPTLECLGKLDESRVRGKR